MLLIRFDLKHFVLNLSDLIFERFEFFSVTCSFGLDFTDLATNLVLLLTFQKFFVIQVLGFFLILLELNVRVADKAVIVIVIISGNDSDILLQMALIIFEGAKVFLLPLKFFKLRHDLFTEDSLNLGKLVVLLLNELESLLFLGLVKTDSGSLFNQPKHFLGLHIDDLGNSALHNKEVRVVDVELDGAKEHLDLFSRLHLPVDIVFRLALFN